MSTPASTKSGKTRQAAAARALPPRERILGAASKLFYEKGIRAVSVDEIAAAAHSNKMTLYRHFPAKDALIAEYLRELARASDAEFDALFASHRGAPEAAFRAWIAKAGEHLCEEGNRGCAVANAAVELPEKDHPARAVIEEHKTHLRERLAKLCADAGFVAPARLADEIFLLLEGARVNVQSVGSCGPGARFAEMANDLANRHRKPK
jgi:AcrR family transcriptional regulator